MTKVQAFLGIFSILAIVISFVVMRASAMRDRAERKMNEKKEVK